MRKPARMECELKQCPDQQHDNGDTDRSAGDDAKHGVEFIFIEIPISHGVAQFFDEMKYCFKAYHARFKSCAASRENMEVPNRKLDFYQRGCSPVLPPASLQQSLAQSRTYRVINRLINNVDHNCCE